MLSSKVKKMHKYAISGFWEKQSKLSDIFPLSPEIAPSSVC